MCMKMPYLSYLKSCPIMMFCCPVDGLFTWRDAIGIQWEYSKNTVGYSRGTVGYNRGTGGVQRGGGGGR